MALHLKSLELHGYKTFASRTAFEFAGEITAIVGPNGSGKSNIADALRWVLGEQSYSILRGKKTEDMIFAGSEQRARAGMASATVVFDNSDGWLPIDFTEVAVARRAYRDGTNEYLLNGQRVRLRDVYEVLAQSGLAERTYTVIGQGLVDAALALKAEERRRLFEEAAGIGLHRSRREEALRRLETTQRNLDRVQDILAEIQPRLRSLERQARRSQEYEQIKNDLRLTMREWYGYHWHQAQIDLSEARELVQGYEKAVDNARKVQIDISQQLQTSRDHMVDLRTRLNTWHRQSAQLHTRGESLGRELAVADERKRSLEEQFQKYDIESGQAEQDVALYQERVNETGHLAHSLKDELSEARSEVDTARLALQARQAEREIVEKAVQTARQVHTALTARQSHLQARLSERQSQADRQVLAFAAAETAAAQCELAVRVADERLRASNLALDQAQSHRHNLEASLASNRQGMADLEKSRKDTLESRAALQADVARCSAQLDVIDLAEKNLSGYDRGIKLLLQAAQVDPKTAQSRLKGSQGTLNTILEVPLDLEVAIAAALGQFVDAIVLEKDIDPEPALMILEEQAAPGALLPLDLCRVPSLPVQASISDPDVMGIAANLVTAPAYLLPVVEVLLSATLIVKDRKTARRILNNPESWQSDLLTISKVVTLRGDVFHTNGPIQTSGASPTVLSRPRQRRELLKKLEATEAQAVVLDQHLKTLENEIASLNTQVEQVNRRLRAARQEEEQIIQARNQDKLALDQAHRQSKWQDEQRHRIETDIKIGSSEIKDMTTELTKIDLELGIAQDGLRSQLALLADLPIEELQTELAHWNTRSAVAEQAVADALIRQHENQVQLDRAIGAQKNLRARLTEIENTCQQLEIDKAATRQVEAQVSEKIEALQVLIQPAEAELDAVDSEQVKSQVVEEDARKALSLAEGHYTQSRISITRRQEALETLRHRIEDDFGLVAFDYAEDVSGPTPLPLSGLVEKLPRVLILSPDIEETLNRQRAQLRRMGAINPEAQTEYREVMERYQFLTEQVNDLTKAEVDIRQIIAELNTMMQREFKNTFEAVAGEFRLIFARLFGGGSARLVLTDPDDLTLTGIDIEARLPGRREQGLSLLSGGERSLTAVALVFALLRVAPTPFCVLDEVDAMLDEANVGRFRDLLDELSQTTQFVIITHNRNTVQAADVIYGVTMGRDSASQVISLKLDEVDARFDERD